MERIVTRTSESANSRYIKPTPERWTTLAIDTRFTTDQPGFMIRQQCTQYLRAPKTMSLLPWSQRGTSGIGSFLLDLKLRKEGLSAPDFFATWYCENPGCTEESCLSPSTSSRTDLSTMLSSINTVKSAFTGVRSKIAGYLGCFDEGTVRDVFRVLEGAPSNTKKSEYFVS